MRHVVRIGSVASSDSGHSTNSSAGEGPGVLPHSFQPQPRCPSPPRHPPNHLGMYFITLNFSQWVKMNH